MAERVAAEDIVLYRGEEDWSALYVKGKLEEVGDHYWVEEKLRQLLGIEEISSDDFLRGGSQREEVAQTLEEIEVYRSARATEEARKRHGVQALFDQLADMEPDEDLQEIMAKVGEKYGVSLGEPEARRSDR